MMKEMVNQAIDALKNLPYGNPEFKLTIKMPQQIRDKGDSFEIETSVNFWHEHKKTKPCVSELKNKYDDDFVVMGGGPNLPDDLIELSKTLNNSLRTVAANHHAFQIHDTEFMCFLDPWDRVSPLFKEVYKKSLATKISHLNLGYTDYYTINESKFHDKSDSGIWAAWFASYITTGKIYLAGMDLCQSEKRHFYDSGVTRGWGGPLLDVKIKNWKELQDYTGGRLIPVSGPLVGKI